MFNPTFDAEDAAKTILLAASASKRTRLTIAELNKLLDPIFEEDQIAYFGFSQAEWEMLQDRRTLWKEICRLRNQAEGEEQGGAFLLSISLNWEKYPGEDWERPDRVSNSQARFFAHALAFFRT